MKYFKRLNIYKASNVEFNPETFNAFSYDWWKFVTKIGNKIIFNDYSYSNTTCKHQSKVLELLNKLDIKIDYYIKCPKGLQNIESGIKYHKYEIELLQKLINNLKSRKATNIKRQAKIVHHLNKIKELEYLIKLEHFYNLPKNEQTPLRKLLITGKE